MYRDLAQWSGIRHPVLKQGTSIREVVRETGISRKTMRKMLRHPLPQPTGRESRGILSSDRIRPQCGACSTETRHPPSARLSIKAIYEHIRDEDGFRGGYSTVKAYVRRSRPTWAASGNTPTTCWLPWKGTRDRLPVSVAARGSARYLARFAPSGSSPKPVG